MVTNNPIKLNPLSGIQKVVSKKNDGQTDRHQYFYVPFHVAEGVQKRALCVYPVDLNINTGNNHE